MVIELVGDDGLLEMNRICLEREEWLAAKGVPMWDKGQFTIEGINKKYENPSVFMVRDYKTIIGGFLLTEHDTRFWKDKKDDAFYLHKLVVKVGCGGKGYSHKMLDWILHYGKEKGKKYIRLDYEKERTYLQQLYTEHKFYDVGIIMMEDGTHFSQAECSLY